MSVQKFQCFDFACPVCNEETSTRAFPEHCFFKHNISSEQCSWCFGHSRPQHVKKHTASCFSIFFKVLLQKIPLETHSDEPVLFNLSPMCQTVQKSYPLPLVDLKYPNLLFQSDSLNLAVACVHTFLKTLESHWYHLKVRQNIWDSFYEAVKGESVTMLPFSCCCVETNKAFHHHLIINCAASVVESIWKKIPRKGIRKETILYPMELVEALDFLSQTESTCNFSSHTIKKRPNHFNITATLPQQHKIILSLQWDNGIVELFHKEYDSVRPEILAPVAFLSGGLWVCFIKNLRGFEKNLILPVLQNLQPTLRKTNMYLSLYQGKKFYFEEMDGSEEWIEKQVNGGNILSNLIGDSIYFPTVNQQKCINLIKPQMVEMEVLERAYSEKMTETEMLEKSVGKLKLTNQSLKRKYNQSEKELKMLQWKHIKYLEQENDVLRMEFENLKRKTI